MSYRNEAEKVAEAKRLHGELVGMDESLPGDLKADILGEMIDTLETEIAAVKKKKSELSAAIEAKNNSFKKLKDFFKRLKSGAKAVYGDDSLEYERVGGKRQSERKRPNRRNGNGESAAA